MNGRRVLAAVLLPLTAAAACSSMRPVADPARFITETRPPVVYVSYETGAIMVLENPHVTGDSVHGTSLYDRREVALPWKHVQTVSTVRFNGGRTALLVGGLVTAGAVVTYAVLGTAKGKSNFTCDYSDPKDYGPTGAPLCGFDPSP